jgi:hypothetical protein
LNIHFSYQNREHYSEIDHIIDYETRKDKFSKIEITSNTFSGHKEESYLVDSKKTLGKCTSIQRLNNLFLNNQLIRK